MITKNNLTFNIKLKADAYIRLCESFIMLQDKLEYMHLVKYELKEMEEAIKNVKVVL